MSAREILADIRAGATDEFLMKKYGISDKGLQSLFQKLVNAKVITQDELDRRAPAVEKVKAVFVEEHADVPPKEKSLEALKDLSERFKLSKEDFERLKTASLKDIREFMEKHNVSLSDAKELLKTLGISAGGLLTHAGGILRDGTRRVRQEFRRRQSSPAEIEDQSPTKAAESSQPIADAVSGEPVKLEDAAGHQERGVAASHPRSVLGLFRKIKTIPAALAGIFVSLLTGQFLLKLLGYLVVLGLFALSVAVITQRHELNLQREAKALVRVDPLPKAKELYKAGEICDALEHLEYYMDFDYVAANPEAKEFCEKLKAERESWLSRTKMVGQGILTGKGSCPEEIFSATASDLAGVGAFRDLTRWGLDKYHGNETRDFEALLAAVDATFTTIAVGGIVVSIVSGGVAAPAGGAAVATATPVKTTVTALRITNRLGKLTAPLKKALTGIFEKAVNEKSGEPIKKVVISINRVKNVPGLKVKDFFKVMSHANDPKDLDRLSNVAHGFGDKTGKFLTLGKDTSLQIHAKFHKDPHLVPALDHALQYGDKGTNAVMKLGPTKFLQIVAPNKTVMTARTLRSVWEGHLTAVLIRILKWIPEWIIFSIALVSGLIVVGMPSMRVYRACQWFRTPA